MITVGIFLLFLKLRNINNVPKNKMIYSIKSCDRIGRAQRTGSGNGYHMHSNGSRYIVTSDIFLLQTRTPNRIGHVMFVGITTCL